MTGQLALGEGGYEGGCEDDIQVGDERLDFVTAILICDKSKTVFAIWQRCTRPMRTLETSMHKAGKQI